MTHNNYGQSICILIDWCPLPSCLSAEWPLINLLCALTASVRAIIPRAKSWWSRQSIYVYINFLCQSASTSTAQTNIQRNRWTTKKKNVLIKFNFPAWIIESINNHWPKIKRIKKTVWNGKSETNVRATIASSFSSMIALHWVKRI